ncbi:unnamed protein product [Brachionus calyciflorus]|uniref:Uncharacterized protein n=1 Tax=Brachionus calyciflorus TaxID=104777 RepID=A0A813X0D3_9BILA|nr:unnamed protein product [Brachionus calyciflorus]
MVTVTREGHVIIRNASLLKPYQSLDDTEISSTTLKATPAPLEPRAGSPTETPQAETQAIQVATPPQVTQAPAQTSAPATTTQPAKTIHDQTNKRKVGRPTKSEAKKIAQEKAKTNPVDSEVEPPRREFSHKHSSKVISILDLNDGRFASCSWDTGIRIWNLEQHVYLIVAHNDQINTLVLLDDESFASGSDDRTIKIWNKDNFNLLITLEQKSQVKSLIKLNQTEGAL